jgi:hypothetical protein
LIIARTRCARFTNFDDGDYAILVDNFARSDILAGCATTATATRRG